MGTPLLPASVYGNSLRGMRNFLVSVSTSASAAQRIDPGAYRMTCDVDCWVAIGKDNTVSAAAFGSTQPATWSAPVTVRLPAGVPTPVPIEAWAGATPWLSAKALAGSGTLTVEGPLYVEATST